MKGWTKACDSRSVTSMSIKVDVKETHTINDVLPNASYTWVCSCLFHAIIAKIPILGRMSTKHPHKKKQKKKPVSEQMWLHLWLYCWRAESEWGSAWMQESVCKKNWMTITSSVCEWVRVVLVCVCGWMMVIVYALGKINVWVNVRVALHDACEYVAVTTHMGLHECNDCAYGDGVVCVQL